MTTATTSNSAADPVALVTGIRGYDPVATAGDFQFEPSETQPAILMGEQGIALAGGRSVVEFCRVRSGDLGTSAKPAGGLVVFLGPQVWCAITYVGISALEETEGCGSRYLRHLLQPWLFCRR